MNRPQVGPWWKSEQDLVMSYHSMGNALKAFRNGSLGADATYVYGGGASTSSGISLPKSGTLTTTTSNDYGNLATLADPLSVFTGAAEGGGGAGG